MLTGLEPRIKAQLDADVAFAENSPMPQGPEALTGVTCES
jgi:hypothetical protein